MVSGYTPKTSDNIFDAVMTAPLVEWYATIAAARRFESTLQEVVSPAELRELAQAKFGPRPPLAISPTGDSYEYGSSYTSSESADAAGSGATTAGASGAAAATAASRPATAAATATASAAASAVGMPQDPGSVVVAPPVHGRAGRQG